MQIYVLNCSSTQREFTHPFNSSQTGKTRTARKRKFYNFLFFAFQFSIISEVKIYIFIYIYIWRNAVFLSRAQISNLCGSDGEEKLLGLRYISRNTLINLVSHQLIFAWSTVGFIPAGAL